MKTDLNYSASDCFETFPFPNADPRTEIPALEEIGERLYEARASYMLDTDQGLTKTYNHLKDATCTDASIVELRRLHEEMDRAVLAAYGWDVDVPPYTTPVTEDEKRRLEAFEDDIVDRLFVLNAERAHEEELLGVGASAKKTKGRSAKKAGGASKGVDEAEIPTEITGRTSDVAAGDVHYGVNRFQSLAYDAALDDQGGAYDGEVWPQSSSVL